MAVDIYAKYGLDKNKWTSCSQCSSCSGIQKFKCFADGLELHLFPGRDSFRLFKTGDGSKRAVKQGSVAGVDLNSV